jgi:hypothetical protein
MTVDELIVELQEAVDELGADGAAQVKFATSPSELLAVLSIYGAPEDGTVVIDLEAELPGKK